MSHRFDHLVWKADSRCKNKNCMCGRLTIKSNVQNSFCRIVNEIRKNSKSVLPFQALWAILSGSVLIFSKNNYSHRGIDLKILKSRTKGDQSYHIPVYMSTGMSTFMKFLEYFRKVFIHVKICYGMLELLIIQQWTAFLLQKPRVRRALANRAPQQAEQSKFHFWSLNPFWTGKGRWIRQKRRPGCGGGDPPFFKKDAHTHQ